jgi:hypothetical protein
MRPIATTVTMQRSGELDTTFLTEWTTPVTGEPLRGDKMPAGLTIKPGPRPRFLSQMFTIGGCF